MEDWSLYCLILFLATEVPLAIKIFLKFEIGQKVPIKKFLLLIAPFIWFVPCIVKGHYERIRLNKMIVSGKIVAIQNLRVTNVFVEGYPEYIPLDCLTDDLSIGDSFYRPPNAGDSYWLYKKDSSGKFREITLYRTGELKACTWKWVDGE